MLYPLKVLGFEVVTLQGWKELAQKLLELAQDLADNPGVRMHSAYCKRCPVPRSAHRLPTAIAWSLHADWLWMVAASLKSGGANTIGQADVTPA